MPRICTRSRRHSRQADRAHEGGVSSCPDLITEARADSCVSRYETFYPEGPKESASLSRIISESQTQRIKGLIENTNGTIVIGGAVDVGKRYVEPTVVRDVRKDDALMSE